MRTGTQVTDPPIWVDVKTAARELSVSVRSIWNYVGKGKLIVTRDFGRIRILRSSLLPNEGEET
jgi:hypothetical protein